MKLHYLKCDPKPFWAVGVEIKKAEFRLNDRGFQLGDHIALQEFENGEYTGQDLILEITHMQTGYGIPDGYVMLSFRVLW